jgi:SAM-dependent methyltransferase
MSDSLGIPAIAQQQFRRRPSAYAMAPSPSDHKFVAFMISIAGAGKGDRVLDVACGTGTATLAFAQRCEAAVGLDVVPEPLALARAAAAERGIANASFTLSEVERFALSDAAFTGAVCRFSFHHFVRPDRVFAEMARVVAPGGWMVVADMTASEDPEKAAFHNQMDRLCDPTHSRTLAISEFEAMFARHGFRVAMKVARDARITVDDWIRFGSPPRENEEKLREMIESAVGDSNDGLKITRDGEVLRLVHNSVSFVIEKEG